MRRSAWLVVAIVVVLITAAWLRPAASDRSPVFADEFGAGPLGDVWHVANPWGLKDNHAEAGEHQYYDDANVSFIDVSGNGNVRLTTEERAVEGREYASGAITSLGHPKFSYGYVEMRAKLPKGRGIWPAFWMIDTENSQEIDIFELKGQDPTKVYLTYHRNGRTVFTASYTGPDFSAGYHTFAVDWQPSYVRWYVDGVQRAEYAAAIPPNPLYLCANTAVGGEYVGPPDQTTVLPQNYDIDYIRVWSNGR